jgi:quinolinate synthase
MSAALEFPSLVVRSDGFLAQGAFAEAQAEFLQPDPERVARLESLLRSRNAGVVSHFYMDAELQGALYACDWPHVHVSDSLLMADRAVAMATGERPVSDIVVLGVDFMSENVRAMMDASDCAEVGVYRVSDLEIGCSLAEAAESRAYAAYLERAARSEKALHVVYINTSLRTKAHAHHRVPTITCTSSNVVQTVLQAFAQEPGIELWFGPDTYMGQNLARMFETYAQLDDAAIRALHPAHDRKSLQRVIERFHYFEQGNCIVHHMFGSEVVETLRRKHPNAHVTAHLEVPGEMFSLALERQRAGQGVVGSTSNILGYIRDQVEAAQAGTRMSFALGTEAGMVTAITRGVRETLSRRAAKGHGEVEVEIIFPVASEAVATTGEGEMPLVPGVAGGEGCSTAGGCATCPYMKMNSLDALIDVLEALGPERDRTALSAHRPRAYEEQIAGRSVAELGAQPILHMRAFQRTGELPPALLEDIRTRRTATAV